MKQFIDKDFLLTTETAKTLYHDYAKQMPIFDYHCHINPKEIYDDRKFSNITQMWLEGDHYKWRLMRSNGIDEKYITGDATDKEKFFEFATMLPKTIGNPMYHWCHLELRNYFDFDGDLNENTAEQVWDLAIKKLQNPDMSVRELIKKSNVKFIGTTDDPMDTLEYHEQIKKCNIDGLTVAPSFRPDKILNIEKIGWKEAMYKLAVIAETPIKTVDDVIKALFVRMNKFNELGCKAADHGMDYACFSPASKEEIQEILTTALNSGEVNIIQAEKFKTYFMLICAKEYYRLNWVLQIHYNCMRNPNTKMFNTLGADSGFDTINTVNCSKAIAEILNALYMDDKLPKTVLYSLNPADNEFLDTIIGAFQGTKVAGKIQHGSAWWFNDTKTGMINQMTSLANLGILGNFIGMLTDSRSFLSYARHEYFRRILCELIGNWVENGEYPNDITRVGKIVQDICYNNADNYFKA